MTRLFRLIAAFGVGLALMIGLAGVSSIPAKADARLKMPAAAASQVPAKVVTDAVSSQRSSGLVNHTYNGCKSVTALVVKKKNSNKHYKINRCGGIYGAVKFYVPTGHKAKVVMSPLFYPKKYNSGWHSTKSQYYVSVVISRR